MSMPREARQARLQLDKLLSAFSIITINSDHCNIFVKALYFTRSTLFFIFSSGSVQLSSVTQSCPTLCDPTDCSTPGLPVHHQLPEFTQTHVHRVRDASNHLILSRPLSSCLQSFPALGSFQMSQLVSSGGQSVGASPSTSVLPMNIQG